MPGGLTLNYRSRGDSAPLDNQVVSIITLGLLCTCLGLYAIDRTYKFMDTDPVTMTAFIYCLSFLLLVHALHSIRDRLITETVMLIIAAFTAMLYAGYILQGNSILMYSILLFAIGILTCGIIFIAREQKFMGAVCITMAAILAIKTTLPHAGSVLASSLLTVCGFMLLFVGGLALMGHPAGNMIRNSTVQDISDEDFPKVFVATVGLLVFVAMTFSVGIADFDGTGNNTVFVLFKFLVSALCTAIGVYAIYHEVVYDGCLYFIVGISSLVSAAGILITGSAPLHFDLIPGALIFILSFAMLKDREYYDGVTSFKYGLIMIIGVFAPGSTILALLITITKVSVTLFAWYTLFTTTSRNMNILDALTKITGEIKWLPKTPKE